MQGISLIPGAGISHARGQLGLFLHATESKLLKLESYNYLAQMPRDCTTKQQRIHIKQQQR